MKQQTCKQCGSIYHTAMFHKERKPIKRTAIKKATNILNNARVPSKNRYGVAVNSNGDAVIISNVKKRKKSTPRALAKTKAWDAFSLYIRTRDCIRFTGDPEQGMCVTCKSMKPRKELQAGHFVGGRGNAVLFDERLVYSQDGYCNQKPPMGLGGNYAAYTLFMFDEGYTRKEIEGFLALKGTTKVYKTHDFIEIEAKYKQKLADLLLTF